MAAVLTDPKLLNQATTTAASGGNTIPYWGYYGGMEGGGAYMDQDPSQSQMGQDFLNGIRKYDPNARFVATTDPNSGATHYTTEYDHSKIPNMSKAIDMNQGDFNPQYRSNLDHGQSEANYLANNKHSFDSTQLYDPTAVGTDSMLGQVTSRRNLKPQGTTLLDILGPMAVGGFGLLAGGGGALASLLQKAPGMIGNAVNGNFNPYQLASAALPYIPGVNPVMAQLGRIGLNYAGSH